MPDRMSENEQHYCSCGLPSIQTEYPYSCVEHERASRPEDFDADYQVNSGSGRFS